MGAVGRALQTQSRGRGVGRGGVPRSSSEGHVRADLQKQTAVPKPGTKEFGQMLHRFSRLGVTGHGAEWDTPVVLEEDVEEAARAARRGQAPAELTHVTGGGDGADWTAARFQRNPDAEDEEEEDDDDADEY